MCVDVCGAATLPPEANGTTLIMCLCDASCMTYAQLKRHVALIAPGKQHSALCFA